MKEKCGVRTQGGNERGPGDIDCQRWHPTGAWRFGMETREHGHAKVAIKMQWSE